MASVDASLNNAYFEDVKRFKIVKGQKFSLLLKRNDDDYVGEIDYASTGDPVLNVGNLQNDAVEVTAGEVGVSRFFFIQKSETEFNIIRQLRVEVVPEIVDPAVDLGLTGEVIDKDL
jgi:hypothetical protein